ncbi:MAG: NAD(P)H-dependent oxidoreductase subunit E, partial [Anaerolineaceae bacterium]|nr:NAD(P)H-dependent oxidoreductase subunit E [Anaerolineaceae bacterium]
CESAPCHIAGAEELLACMVELLGTQPGKTSEDGRWTLMTTSCLGQCAEGPVVVIDDEIHSRVTRETLPEILSHYD